MNSCCRSTSSKDGCDGTPAGIEAVEASVLGAGGGSRSEESTQQPLLLNTLRIACKQGDAPSTSFTETVQQEVPILNQNSDSLMESQSPYSIGTWTPRQLWRSRAGAAHMALWQKYADGSQAQLLLGSELAWHHGGFV